MESWKMGKRFALQLKTDRILQANDQNSTSLSTFRRLTVKSLIRFWSSLKRDLKQRFIMPTKSNSVVVLTK